MFNYNPNSTRNCITILIYGVIFSIFTLQVETTALSSKSVRSGYGEYCNKTIRCASQLWLACDRDSNTCQCAKPDEMVYDRIKQKCTVLIGERCKYGFDEDEIPTALWYEKAECVQNAVCGPSGLCSCPDGFYEDEELIQCSLLKNYGQSCIKSSECNKEKLLSCFAGQCQCDPDKAIYNVNSFPIYFPAQGYNSYNIEVPEKTCIGRVGSRCNIDRNSSSKKSYCIRNADCNSGTCQCKRSYAVTSDRLCGLGYDEDCSAGQVCSDQLRCTGRNLGSTRRFRCECPYPQYQEYDSSNKTCGGLLGAPCHPHDSTSCKKGSVCIERDNMFQCECDEGFVENLGGTCDIAFGQRCDSSTVTNCDTKANLQCKDSKCLCENDVDIYEQKKRQCSRPVGVRCDNDTECVSSAVCLIISTNLFGRCACNEGYSVTKNHTCVSDAFNELDWSGENSTVTVPSVTTGEVKGRLDIMADEGLEIQYNF